MSPRDVDCPVKSHGDVLTAISDGMVALLKEFYGHGPSRTKSYYADDLVVCVLRGGFSRVEQTMIELEFSRVVTDTRSVFQDAMAHKFISAVERLSGRDVLSFSSNHHVGPDIEVELFMLRPKQTGTSWTDWRLEAQ